MDDLVVHFSWLYVCRLFPDSWFHVSAEGSWAPNAPSAAEPGGFALRVLKCEHKKSRVFVSLTNLSGPGYISLLLLDGPYRGKALAKYLVASSGTCKQTKHLSFEVRLQVDRAFTLVAFMLDAKGSPMRPDGDQALGEFRIDVYSMQKASLQKL
jgi:hypothetical protein